MLFYVIQVLVPIGYMPASFAEEGTFIKFCPSGVSDSVMAVLHAGHDQHQSTPAEKNHSAHMGHDDHQHHNHKKSSLAQSDANSPHAHHQHYGHYQANALDHSQNHSNNHADHSASSACEYASASFNSDVAILKAGEFSQTTSSFIKLQLLTYQDVVSQLHRKQRSRAPPSFSFA